jgi:RimJ/RimL family protein N-acetyltransferase
VGEYRDEAFSAYHGDRGPGLAQAREHATRLATEHGRPLHHRRAAQRPLRKRRWIAGQRLAELWFAPRRVGGVSRVLRQRHPLGRGLISRDDKDVIIGSSRFHGFDPDRREVEIGWTFLARSHWGGKANRELKSLMLDHACLFVDRVVFLVGPQNVKSQRALDKIGAVAVEHAPMAQRASCSSYAAMPG